MRYLLDTNILSDLIRNPQGRVAQHIREIGETAVCTSIIVAAELQYGAGKKASPKLTAQLETVLGAVDILPFEAPAEITYGQLGQSIREGECGYVYEACAQSAHWVGGNDLLIAAQAVTLGYTLVTDNEREFVRINGLCHENWLR